MNYRRGNLGLGVLLLMAAAPLHAQLTTYGCPGGSQQSIQLNGFTAGSQTDAQICLQGAAGTWLASIGYVVTVTDTLTNVSAQASKCFSLLLTLMIATIPYAFFASVQTPGQPDPVIDRRHARRSLLLRRRRPVLFKLIRRSRPADRSS